MNPVGECANFHQVYFVCVCAYACVHMCAQCALLRVCDRRASNINSTSLLHPYPVSLLSC